ncbi:MAG: hypothetical protein CMJ44_00230 [Pimelobacter sp.]|nr:hypothetical protein [Pimelobacter sp.]
MSRLSSFRVRVLSGLVGLAVGLSCSYFWASWIELPVEGCSGNFVFQPLNLYVMDAIWLVLGQVGHVLVALAIVQVGASLAAALRR